MNDSYDSFEDVFARYVDRLNAGEGLDKQRIRAENPFFADRLLEELEAYELFGGELEAETPLGTLGDYTLRRQIGRGGMGVVYEAWENSMDRTVALKVLPSAVAADSRATTRFLREAQTAGKLNHPNVVGVYSTGVKEGTPWYAMELVEGETLVQLLARLKDVEPETETAFGPKDHGDYFVRLARAFAEVADGLQHAHSKGVTHRDIKPSNLILDSDGRLRILDFGLARLEGQESLTLSGEFVGTPLYTSPEQARREKVPVDHRTDVYSLGATMYETICGRPPFRGKDHADTLSQIIERDPVEPQKVNPRVPRDLETIVLKCLRKEAGDRYGTAEALGQDLRRFVRGDPVEARPEPRAERFVRWLRKVRVKLSVTAAFLALVVAMAWIAHARRAAERETLDARYEPDLLSAISGVLFGHHVRSLEPEHLAMRASTNEWLYTRYRQVRADDLDMLFSTRSQSVGRTLSRLEALTEGLPDRLDGYYYLARARLLLGFEEGAARAIDQALRIDSEFLPARALALDLRNPGVALARSRPASPRISTRRPGILPPNPSEAIAIVTA